jgi:hypothetical protein
MTGFSNTDVSHMYGNKHFALNQAVLSTTETGAVVLDLRSKLHGEKAPVSFTLAPADAVRIGEALVERGRSMAPESVQ